MTIDADLDDLLATVAERALPAKAEGTAGNYTPRMAEADTDTFGLAVVEMDGTEHVTGDVDVAFPIQSISKVFALVLAMQKVDANSGVANELWRRVGVEPSGDPFNSLVQLEHERGVPRNPMINAGALVVDDVLLDYCDDAKASLTSLIGELIGEEVETDADVEHEQGSSSHRNRSMAFLMSSFGNLTHAADDVLGLYNHQCSVRMTTRQLARSARFLANGGVDPATGKRILSDELTRRVAAIMLTCGTYDAAGEFAFDVGIPCKSGVAGAIVGVMTGELGVGVWSPPLDSTGNSAAGRVALHELAERLELSLF